MDFVDRLSGRARNFSTDGLLKFTQLTPAVQQHVQKVYATLACALAVAAAGAYVNIITGFGGWLSMIGSVVCTVWLLSTAPVPQNLNKRYALLAGTAFSNGMSLGPLIAAAVSMDSTLVLTAFMGTATLFACFSAAALVARRRSMLYLGGTLSSAVGMFMMMRFATWMFPGARSMAFSAELYGGLLVFVGYVCYDTQVIVESAFQGHMDHIKHALDLFVDFVSIFVRILVILMQKEQRKEDKRRKRE